MATPHRKYADPRSICKKSSSLSVLLGNHDAAPFRRPIDGNLLSADDEAVNWLSGILELSSSPTGL